jgi:hypothetical protein
MGRFRTRIGTLVIAVMIVGVALAALRQSNEIWDASIVSLTIAFLLMSVLLAVHRTEARRAFWVGFAVFGSVYLALSAIPSISSRLVTTRALAYLDSKVHRPVLATLGVAFADFDTDGMVDLLVTNQSQMNKFYIDKGNGTFEDASVSAGMTSPGQQVLFDPIPRFSLAGTTEHFMRIGQSSLALLAALVGGLISRHLYAKKHLAAHAVTSIGIEVPAVR